MNQAIQRALNNAITIEQLIEDLQEIRSRCGDETRVFFSSDYGDHSHTEQALPINEIKEETVASLYETAYSDSSVALRNSEDDEDQDDQGETIVVLRY